MYIETLQLNNFRNYEDEKIEFDQRVNVVTGKNGQGKTNLIEGINILSMGKSFRTLFDMEMVGFEKDFFRVKGLFVKGGENLSVEMRLAGKDRKFIIDGAEKKKNADLLEHVYTVVFSPEDLKIVSDDPEKRRRFMNRELFQLKPLYYMELLRYKKALKSRNLLLKEEQLNEDLLLIYDDYLAESGARIMNDRAMFVERINTFSRDIEDRITGGKEELAVHYESNIEQEKTKEAQKERILSVLAENREKDLEKRSTSSGPHRDDLKITSNGIDLRHFGSRGQQRTAALSLKLAELKLIREETGEEAILLLDDVLSELDEERQHFLIHSFEKNQLFITAAELSENMKKNLPSGRIYEVQNGKVNSLTGSIT
ncbi:MAG: DNA replication/repair protein RecF [Clostridiales Family XIII bacterium]|jgi:DNA replication and repair protein RecF|nr:DNA replication/repair protein RecF [Clostridiales Family XIII bacterium]